MEVIFCAEGNFGAGPVPAAGRLRRGVVEYAERPLIPRRRTWADLDGDGQRECVLYVERDPEDYIQDGFF